MKTLYKTVRTLLLLSAFILCTNVHAQDKKEATTTTDNKDKTGVKNDDKKPDDPDDKAKKEKEKEEEEKERKRWQTSGNYADSLHWLGTINNYPLVFKTNNTEWLRLTPAGRLGLGTNNPSASFDVIGDIRSSTLGGNGNALVASDKDGILRRFNFSSDSAHVLYGNGTWAPLPAPIDWQVSGNNMYSIPSGNVGIGVSNANERLEVAGNIKADSIILTKGLSVPPSQVVNITNLTTNNFQTTNIVTSKITPDTSGIIAFGQNTIMIGSSDKANVGGNVLYTDNPKAGFSDATLYIQSKAGYNNNTVINANNTGRVGIGTDDPKAKLHIQSSSPAEVIVEGGDKGYVNAAIVLKATQVANYRGTGVFMHDLNAGNEWFAGRPYANSNRFVIQFNDKNPDHDARTAGLNDGGGASTETKRYFTVESNGNVGIGQFIPQYTLDVLGPVRATQYLVGSGSTATPLISSQWVTSGNTISYSNGKVSIGTTSTANSGLEVISNSPTEVSVQGTATAGGYTNAAIVLKAVNAKPSDANYRATGIFMHDDGADNEWFVGRPYAGSDRFVIQRNVTADHSTATAAMHTGNGPSDPTTTKRFFTIEKNGEIKFDRLAGKGRRQLYVDNDGYITDPDFSVDLVTTNPTSADNDGSITATVTSPGNSVYAYYLWSNGATDATITGLSHGSYNVTVTNTSGRSVTASTILFKEKQKKTIKYTNAGGEIFVTTTKPCPGTSDGSIKISDVVDGIESIDWKCTDCSNEAKLAVDRANTMTDAALQANQTTFEYSFPAGNYSIDMLYYPPGGNEASLTINAPLSDEMTIQETVTDPSPLSGENGSVTEKVIATGNTNAYFTWSPTSVGTVTTAINTSTLSNVPAGFYTCTITSDVGCKVNKNIFVGSSYLASWNKDGNAGTDPATNFIGTTDAKGFVLRTDNKTRMQITANGNVGIGPSAPHSDNNLEVTNSIGLWGGSTVSPVRAQLEQNGYHFYMGENIWYGKQTSTSTTSSWNKFDDNNGTSQIRLANDHWGDGSGRGAISFYTGSKTDAAPGIQRMIINEVGNVGIGASDLTYKLNVNGTVRAKEVIVSTDWSDFVFEKNYELMPLTEVNSFIQKNKHLPGIPDAREIQTNGLKVAEAQTLMMQKIEEFTLYLLEQNKQLQELQKQNELLKKQVNELNNAIRK